MKEKVFLAQSVVILLSGKAGSGKTTLANIMKSLLDYTGDFSSGIFSFAKRVKEIASFCGWDGNKDEKGRRLLQYIGNFGREVNEDFWASYLFNNEISNSIPDFIIIDDNRFQNEIEYFSKIFSQIYPIRIVSNLPTLDGELSNDISETSLPENNLYTTIYNTGSKEDLAIIAVDTLKEILDKTAKF